MNTRISFYRARLCFIALLTLALTAARAYAYTLPSLIRVGLEAKYRNADAVPVGNSHITVALGSADGLQAVCGSVMSASGFKMAVDNNGYSQSGGMYSDFNQALQAASGSGAAVAVLGGNNYGLYYPNAQGQASSSRVSLTDGGRAVVIFDAAAYSAWIMDAAGQAVKIGERNYRGAVEFGRQAGKKITPVNVLTADEYLYSVVPAEMPPKWSAEALKAQAVAARSYTLTRMGVHKTDGYDICDGGHCQNYTGAGGETAATNSAVDETRGLLVYYGDEPINATYFHSSGGFTADSEHVWSNALGYMRGVAEISEYEPRVWTRALSLAEITELLNGRGESIGSAVSVSVGSTGAGGRVNELIINGTGGSVTLTKEDIRNFFASSEGGALESRNFTVSGVNTAAQQQSNTAQGLSVPVYVTVTGGYTTRGAELGALYALSASGPVNITGGITAQSSGYSYNYAQQISAPAAAVTAVSGGDVFFSGRGYGHGVGMSQHGAEGMARMGYNFRQILEHYYTGAVVR